MAGATFKGVSLKSAPGLKSRRRETPYLVQALTSKSKAQAKVAISSGRVFTDRNRMEVLSTLKK